METSIPIGQFKTHCYHLLDQAQKENKEIIITKRGKPIAKILPFKKARNSLFGIMKGKAFIKENILDPLNSTWDAESE